MKTRVIAFIAGVFLLSNFASIGIAGPNTKNVKKAKASQLVAMLPAVDAVVTFDVSKFFNEALPTVFAASQPMLTDILGKIDKMQSQTGIDIRKFETIAAGGTMKKGADGKVAIDGVVIARGQVTSASLIDLAKKAAEDKFREETVAGKTVYIFAAKALAKDKASADDAKKAAKIEQYANIPSEMALTAIDANTVAFGQVGKVRETLEAKTRVGSDLTELLNRRPTAAVNMAAKVPAGASTFMPLDNDDLGRNIDSIQYVFGNMDASAGQMQMNMTARTQQITQAKELYETLDVMKSFGKMALGSSKRADQQLYARLIDNVQFSRVGTEVSMDLVVPQADIDQLMGILTKKK
ncbi:MAG: hypothetical protein QUS14_02230 [Pyrinomonadaceae bacterium]|nr:hypothetical protein [Pyrinomonadaceae bacterium]